MDDCGQEFYLLTSYVMRADRGVSCRKFRQMVKNVKIVGPEKNFTLCTSWPGFVTKSSHTMMMAGGENSYVIEFDMRTKKLIKQERNPLDHWVLNHLKWKQYNIWFGLNGSIVVTSSKARDLLHVPRKNFLHEFSVGPNSGFWNHSRNVALYNTHVYYVTTKLDLVRVDVDDLCKTLSKSKDVVLASSIADFCITPVGELFLLQKDGLLYKHESKKCEFRLNKAEDAGFHPASMTSNESEFFASLFDTKEFKIKIYLLSWRLKALDSYVYQAKSDGEFPIMMRAFRLNKPHRLRLLAVCRHSTFVDLFSVFQTKLQPVSIGIKINENWLYGLEWNQYLNQIVIPQPGKTFMLTVKF